jgi:hypothetical protein
MTKIVMTIAAVTIALLASNDAARAQRYTNYPVCAVYGGWRGGTESCAFMNFQQCYMSVSGRGGYCIANAFYEPPRGRRAVKKRKHY